MLMDTAALEESRNLSFFLATQNKIRDDLQKGLVTIDNHEELLADIVAICVKMYDYKRYVEPAEKHMLVKVSLGVKKVEVEEKGLLVLLDKERLEPFRMYPSRHCHVNNKIETKLKQNSLYSFFV